MLRSQALAFVVPEPQANSLQAIWATHASNSARIRGCPTAQCACAPATPMESTEIHRDAFHATRQESPRAPYSIQHAALPPLISSISCCRKAASFPFAMEDLLCSVRYADSFRWRKDAFVSASSFEKTKGRGRSRTLTFALRHPTPGSGTILSGCCGCGRNGPWIGLDLLLQLLHCCFELRVVACEALVGQIVHHSVRLEPRLR